MKDERIPSREMTAPEQEAGIHSRQSLTQLGGKCRAGWGVHSGAVLPPGGRWEHCSDEPGQVLQPLGDHPFLPLQPPAQEPH